MKNPKYKYHLKDGKIVQCARDCCLVCNHCTVFFYDSQSIYMTVCEITDDIIEDQICEKFVLSRKQEVEICQK